jgi:hypothetical protein
VNLSLALLADRDGEYVLDNCSAEIDYVTQLYAVVRNKRINHVLRREQTSKRCRHLAVEVGSRPRARNNHATVRRGLETYVNSTVTGVGGGYFLCVPRSLQ